MAVLVPEDDEGFGHPDRPPGWNHRRCSAALPPGAGGRARVIGNVFRIDFG
ncbi:hypothetical protein BURCENBC7_AP6316 [Burkholderia cenocepacia BC7]|nr:hypothetical protein BURCENK562V_C1907 [Burkholderia cenocepacia K56-2Valvano]ERI29997.1 hypothetical protein BURCENBC7_AP6316 [Burkholderia cenocepacia BC7]